MNALPSSSDQAIESRVSSASPPRQAPAAIAARETSPRGQPPTPRPTITAHQTSSVPIEIAVGDPPPFGSDESHVGDRNCGHRDVFERPLVPGTCPGMNRYSFDRSMRQGASKSKRDRRLVACVAAALTALALAATAAPAGAASSSSAQDEYTLDNPGAGGGGSLSGKKGANGKGANAKAANGQGANANGKGSDESLSGKGAASERGVGDIASDSSSNTGIILLLIALVAIAGAGAVFVIRRRRATAHTD